MGYVIMTRGLVTPEDETPCCFHGCKFTGLSVAVASLAFSRWACLGVSMKRDP